VSPLLDSALHSLAAAPLLVAVALYAARARALAARGRPVAPWRLAAAASGALLVLAALGPPLDALAERSLAWHMAQHLLLADLAALLLAAGLTGPLLRPLLARRAIWRLRALAHPAAAGAVWAAVLGAWHVPALYEAALAHPALHALQHASFLGAGLLAWLPLLEPVPAPRGFGLPAKLAYSLLVRAWMAGIGYVLLFASRPLYGFPLADQQLAAGVMMLEGAVVGLLTAVVLLAALLARAETAQRLAEAGAAPRRVERARRHG
jgi:cytochrome c oxidase assembly factor CtaG